MGKVWHDFHFFKTRKTAFFNEVRKIIEGIVPFESVIQF